MASLLFVRQTSLALLEHGPTQTPNHKPAADTIFVCQLGEQRLFPVEPYARMCRVQHIFWRECRGFLDMGDAGRMLFCKDDPQVWAEGNFTLPTHADSLPLLLIPRSQRSAYVSQ